MCDKVTGEGESILVQNNVTYFMDGPFVTHLETPIKYVTHLGPPLDF